MRLINRYLHKTILSATAIVLLVLLGLEIVMEFLGQLPAIGTAHYSIGYALLYVLMQLPYDGYQLFPMVAFLGCLIGLGRLASNSELVVMRAAGMSIGTVMLSVVKVAIFMLVIMTFIGQVVAPPLQSYAKDMRTRALGHSVDFNKLPGGVWLRDRDVFVHFGVLNSINSVSDVTSFEINKQHQLLAAAYAPYAKSVNKQWYMRNVQQSILTQDSVRVMHLASKPLNVVFDPSFEQRGGSSVDALSIKALYQSIKYRWRAGLAVSQYEYTLWQRLLQPITVIVMLCLGVPFVFGSLRSASMGLRVLVGVMVGFSFYIINQFFGPLSMVYQIPAVVAALIPTVIFALACVILLRRVH